MLYTRYRRRVNKKLKIIVGWLIIALWISPGLEINNVIAHGALTQPCIGRTDIASSASRFTLGISFIWVWEL